MQFWLSDKLNLIQPPPPGHIHHRAQFYIRELHYNLMTTKEWNEFMEALALEEIFWRVPWLDLADMTFHSAGYDRVVIPGMTSYTFYIPGCFLHQLGVSPGRTRARIEGFETLPFTV